MQLHKLFFSVYAFICMFIIGSCSILLKSGIKGDYVYGEGISPESKSEKFAKAIAADFSRADIINYAVDKYRMYYQQFINETGLPEDSEVVRTFDDILKQFSPKPGAIDIRIEGIEIKKSTVKEKEGKYKSTVISRVHIGSIDKTLLKKIETDQSLFPVFMKTTLYSAMRKRIDDFEKKQPGKM